MSRLTMSNLVAILAAVLVSGCVVGQKLEEFQPAHSPEGVSVDVTSDAGTIYAGELLEADEAAVTLLSGDRILHVRAEAIEEIGIDELPETIRTRGMPLDAGQLAILQPHSRFPAGMSEDVLSELLAAVGQTAVQSIPAARR